MNIGSLTNPTLRMGLAVLGPRGERKDEQLKTLDAFCHTLACALHEEGATQWMEIYFHHLGIFFSQHMPRHYMDQSRRKLDPAVKLGFQAPLGSAVPIWSSHDCLKH